MLEIVLCDDHVSFRQELEEKIKDIIEKNSYDMTIALSTKNPEDIIEYIRNDNKMKIYILETKFDGSMNGIELAQEIRNHDSRGVIIFLTVDSLEKLSMFKYHIEVMDVIDKEDDNYLIRLEKCLLRGNKRCGVKKNNLHKFLKVYIRGVATKAIPIRNIISIETLNAGCGSIIYLKDKTTIRYSKSLKYVLDKYDNEFVQIHRSILINRQHIAKVDLSRNLFITSDNRECYASRNGIKMYKSQYI